MWALDPDRVHLNHGSFGATPVPVLEAQRRLVARMEAAPNRFMINELPGLIDRSRQVTASFVGADPDGLVFVTNASAGIAAVLRSLEPRLSPGDEVVTQSHDYNAVRQMLRHLTDRRDLVIKVAEIPFPIGSPREAVDAVLAVVTDRTRLLVVDHITSPTGLILPIAELVDQLEPDIPVLVDGAHGPGQVPLDLESLGASWYAGNLHKWVCAPKGAGFLYTRADKRDMTVPTVISHAWNAEVPEGSSRYRGLFDWTGTDDFTPWMVVPEAIETIETAYEGGWPGVMARNHEMVLAARDLLADALGADSPAPDGMLGSMAPIRLSVRDLPDPGGDLSPLMFDLLDQGFETLISIWPSWPSEILRLSAHLHNSPDDYAALANVLVRRPAIR